MSHGLLNMGAKEEGQGAKTEGAVIDAPQDNWVDAHAPAWSRPYLRLSRADRPIGTWLLFIPCLWGVLLAALSTGGLRLWDLWIILGCGLGAFLMRGAGCTWNDITDREFDAQVARTRSRPLPSGQVSVTGSVSWMLAQSLAAFAILITYSTASILMGVASLVLVAIYPFAKRFTWWPQVFLGLAFNWGILFAWVAHGAAFGAPPMLLYAAGLAWTLFYDTIYAHQDTEDDALIGVKSTARLFGEHSPRWLAGFMVATTLLMTAAIVLALPDAPSLVLAAALAAPWALGWHMTLQLRQFEPSDGPKLLQLFRSNRNAGLLAAAFLSVALALG
ncbi:MAG: 4-hydroxybenzoate octaprenyltransferase [Pseudomonadota bacterium]